MKQATQTANNTVGKKTQMWILFWIRVFETKQCLQLPQRAPHDTGQTLQLGNLK